MENQQLTQLIRRELPGILRRDREMREWVLSLTRERYADKGETESRFDRVLDELRRDREENTRKWEENRQYLERILVIVEAILGIRYEPDASAYMKQQRSFEQMFYDDARRVLEDIFQQPVHTLQYYDEAGEVLIGRPDDVRLDAIYLENGLVMCELRSSVSKADMYTFERKVAFYEKFHQCQVDRKLVISPMMDERARVLATKLGVEVYSSARDVTR